MVPTAVLQTSLRGDRDYITGADLCDSVNQIVLDRSAQQSWLAALKFRQFTKKFCVLMPLAEIQKGQSIVATGRITDGRTDAKLAVVETKDPVISRVAFDEQPIRASAVVDGDTIQQTTRAGLSFIDEAVGLTKLLHTTTIGGGGQWIFTSIELSERLLDTDDPITVTIGARVGDSATRSTITAANRPIASIGFRKVAA